MNPPEILQLRIPDGASANVDHANRPFVAFMRVGSDVPDRQRRATGVGRSGMVDLQLAGAVFLCEKSSLRTAGKRLLMVTVARWRRVRKLKLPACGRSAQRERA